MASGSCDMVTIGQPALHMPAFSVAISFKLFPKNFIWSMLMDANTVTLGTNDDLFSSALRADGWNWYPFPALTEPMAVTAKTRHSQHEQAATVFPEENGFARVEFESPQRAITPGQAVVLYRDDIVIGGGTIREVL